jgi:hypothetical protein
VELVSGSGCASGSSELPFCIATRTAGLSAAEQLAARAAPRTPQPPTPVSLDLVAGSGIEFTDYGVHELKGVPEGWHLHEVA